MKVNCLLRKTLKEEVAHHIDMGLSRDSLPVMVSAICGEALKVMVFVVSHSCILFSCRVSVPFERLIAFGEVASLS